jgi:hypothetical protein
VQVAVDVDRGRLSLRGQGGDGGVLAVDDRQPTENSVHMPVSRRARIRFRNAFEPRRLGAHWIAVPVLIGGLGQGPDRAALSRSVRSCLEAATVSLTLALALGGCCDVESTCSSA